RNDGGGSFTDVASGPVAAAGGLALWGDVDNDGDLDLSLMREEGGSTLLRNDGNGVFVDITPPGPYARARAAAWGDYDNDGDEDVFLADDVAGSTSHLLANDGSGAFTEVLAGAVPGPEGNFCAWGDFDADGDLDLFVARAGANQLLRNDAGQFVDVT